MTTLKKTWTPAEYDDLVKQFKEHKSIEQIVSKTGRTEATILYALHKIVKQDVDVLHMTKDQIIEKYGATYDEIMALSQFNYKKVFSLREKNNELKFKIEHIKLLIEYDALVNEAKKKGIDISAVLDVPKNPKVTVV